MAKKKAAKKKASRTATRSKKTSTKVTKKTKKAPVRARRPAHLDTLDKKTLTLIEKTAERVRTKINSRTLPELRFPIRSLSNVKYDKRVGYFQLGRGAKTRALSVNTVRNFAQTLRLMAISKDMVENDDFATKREAYYVSKNWGDAKFKDQPESDSVMDDIEALASLDGLNREQLRFYPEEHGGSVAGNLVVIDRDPETGKPIEIDCTGFGTGSYSIPHSVEHLRFKTDAKFVIVIETGGMFQRLNNHKFWKTAKCILVEMGGVPTRANRRFVRILSDTCSLPVYVFTDGDPYGYSNIYRTMKVGSGNAAHINEYFCVPNACLIGVTPQDIIDYNLPTHPLEDKDKKRAQDAIKNDPFFLFQDCSESYRTPIA